MTKSIRNKLLIILSLLVVILLLVLFSLFKPKVKEEVIPTPSPTPEPTLVPTPEPTPEPLIIDTTSDASINKIVNKDSRIDEAYVPQLVKVDVARDANKDVELRPEAAEALKEMFAQATSEGINLKVISSYRSYTTQKSLWYTYQEKYGTKFANRMDSIAGASEHQLGLAIDLGQADNRCKLYECFQNTSAGKWLFENSYKYGYILRYPKGKESVTGIMFSPWHYRYIGKEEAQKVYESNLTLEEFYK